MNIEAILEALDAGLDIEQVSMLERLIRRLRDEGITDEQEQYRAAAPGAADGTAMTTAELLRLRDEVDTGHRLVVDDAPEHHGVRISVAVSDRHRLTTALDLADLECLIAELSRVADRKRRELCVLCDSLGLVDGPDGPEFCTHAMTDVACMR